MTDKLHQSPIFNAQSTKQAPQLSVSSDPGPRIVMQKRWKGLVPQCSN